MATVPSQLDKPVEDSLKELFGFNDKDFSAHHSDLYVKCKSWIQRKSVSAWAKKRNIHHNLFVGINEWQGEYCIEFPFQNINYWNKK